MWRQKILLESWQVFRERVLVIQSGQMRSIRIKHPMPITDSAVSDRCIDNRLAEKLPLAAGNKLEVVRVQKEGKI
ncbi:hypothetical protein WS97_28165 [Burkholderia territorii]|nr:hypothetical protein WS97_28165 [Burkholderia territorii]